MSSEDDWQVVSTKKPNKTILNTKQTKRENSFTPRKEKKKANTNTSHVPSQYNTRSNARFAPSKSNPSNNISTDELIHQQPKPAPLNVALEESLKLPDNMSEVVVPPTLAQTVEEVSQGISTLQIEPEPEPVPVKPKAWGTGARPAFLATMEPEQPIVEHKDVDFGNVCMGFSYTNGDLVMPIGLRYFSYFPLNHSETCCAMNSIPIHNINNINTFI
jgi:hypothetical protein